MLFLRHDDKMSIFQSCFPFEDVSQTYSSVMFWVMSLNSSGILGSQNHHVSPCLRGVFVARLPDFVGPQQTTNVRYGRLGFLNSGSRVFGVKNFSVGPWKMDETGTKVLGGCNCLILMVHQVHLWWFLLVIRVNVCISSGGQCYSRCFLVLSSNRCPSQRALCCEAPWLAVLPQFGLSFASAWWCRWCWWPPATDAPKLTKTYLPIFPTHPISQNNHQMTGSCQFLSNSWGSRHESTWS